MWRALVPHGNVLATNIYERVPAKFGDKVVRPKNRGVPTALSPGSPKSSSNTVGITGRNGMQGEPASSIGRRTFSRVVRLDGRA